MAQLIINGGRKLKGIWRPSGNKNEALPLIAASLLFRKGLTLTNVPDIEDTRVMLDIARSLGVRVRRNNGSIRFSSPKKPMRELSLELSSRVRGSVLFIAPLLINGTVNIPATGGDRIGIRPIDTHLEMFKAFGAKVSGSSITLKKKELYRRSPVLIWLSEPSVTATENALMLASARPFKTIIKNAACEPHIIGLGRALEQAGVTVTGLGTNLIEMTGTRIFKRVSHRVSEDFMEAGSALVMSAVSGGAVKVAIEDPAEYQLIFNTFRKFGKKVVRSGELYSVVDGPKTKDGIRTLNDDPWPNFPSDLMSVMIVLASQCSGQFLFHEKMFESRLYFTDQLNMLGAQVVLCDPHRVLVTGPSRLHGTTLVSPDIRAGMALVIAALIARGQSVINNSQQLDRGYEGIMKKLKAVRARAVLQVQ